MAGPARYTALLDACVLYPLATCDALISVAAAGLYAAKWTTLIDQEWMRALERERGKPEGSFVRRREFMHQAVPDWEVPQAAWERIAGSLTLPDPGDVHVLAAAIAAHADCIVTANLKHFPASAVADFRIQVTHPDEFLVAQLDLDYVTVLTAFKKMRIRCRNPAFTPDLFADVFERNQLVNTAQRLRDALDLL
jgi:hypothetical protein